MEINSEKKLSCDLEVSFLDINFDEFFNTYGNREITGCTFEDKANLGWGTVVSKDEEIYGYRQDISNIVISYITSLDELLVEVRKNHSNTKVILRIAIYYNTYNLTFSIELELISLLKKYSIELDVSIYNCSPPIIDGT